MPSCRCGTGRRRRPVTRCPTCCSSAASAGQPDGAAQHEALPRRCGQQIGVLEHADDLAARCQHRHVPQSALQHLHQHGVGGQVGGDRAGGRAHHRGDRHVDGQARGDHPGPQVAVGEDAETAVGQPDQRVGHVVLGHLHDGVAHRRVRRRRAARRRARSSATGLLSVAGAIVGRSAVLDSTPRTPGTPVPPAWRTAPAPAAPGSRISVLGTVVRASKSIPPPVSSGM